MPYAPEGNPLTAEIVFVGEAPARNEMREGRPFAGAAGAVHDECLEYSSIMRSYTYIDNVFDYPVFKEMGKSHLFDEDRNLLYSDTKEGFTALGMKSVDRLEKALATTTANVIVPLGGTAFRAICGGRKITKWRGSILPATMEAIKGRKCIPTIHPAAALHGQYVNRYIIRSDYKKAKRQAEFPEIIRPPYRFQLRPTFMQCIEFLKHLRTNVDKYAADIEIGFVDPDGDPIAQITRISFAWSSLDAISIPYADGGWTEEQEATLWLETAKTLETEGSTKIFHNGGFDCQVLFFIHGILTAPHIEDTMIGHHIVYTDFLKSLAFCASIHTDQPFWKDMVKHGQIENPEG